MREGKAPALLKPSSRLIPQVYNKSNLSLVWGEVEPMLEKSIEVSQGMITMGVIKMLIDDGRGVVFTTQRDGRIEAALVARVVEYATYNAARIVACAGRNLAEASQFIDVIEEWAFNAGCVEIEGWCRPSMTRLANKLGWKTKVSIVTRDLRRKLQ